MLVLAWVLLVPAADWLAHHDVGSAKGPLLQTARDTARGRLLTLGAGLLAGAALLFAVRALVLFRRGQVTDRYAKAIEQLGSALAGWQRRRVLILGPPAYVWRAVTCRLSSPAEASLA